MLLGVQTRSVRFDAPQFLFCNDVASRAAVLLDNALLYEKVREADARKNEFLAMLGHELRNPDGADPLLPCTCCASRTWTKQKRAWSLDVIDRQVGQLSRLVDDLLDVSRITRGKIELKLESVGSREAWSSTAVETCQPPRSSHSATSLRSTRHARAAVGARGLRATRRR